MRSKLLAAPSRPRPPPSARRRHRRSPPRRRPAGTARPRHRSCLGHPRPPPFAACQPLKLVDGSGEPPSAPREAGDAAGDLRQDPGRHPERLQGDRPVRRRPHRRHRRRLRLPQRRARPRASTAASSASSACTRANGCLTIINQTGGTTLPRFNVGWAREQASTSTPSRPPARPARSCSSRPKHGLVRQPRRGGQHRCQRGRRRGDLQQLRRRRPPPTDLRRGYYNHPGIAVTASTGDNGYQGGSFPASSHYVTAVGGTSLSRTRRTPAAGPRRLERRRVGLHHPQRGTGRPDLGHDRLQRSRHRRRLRRRRPRRPAWPPTRRLTQRPPRGRSTAAPASPRRSSPRSTRSPATRPATPTPSRTPTRRACST